MQPQDNRCVLSAWRLRRLTQGYRSVPDRDSGHDRSDPSHRRHPSRPGGIRPRPCSGKGHIRANGRQNPARFTARNVTLSDDTPHGAVCCTTYRHPSFAASDSRPQPRRTSRRGAGLSPGKPRVASLDFSNQAHNRPCAGRIHRSARRAPNRSGSPDIRPMAAPRLQRRAPARAVPRSRHPTHHARLASFLR